MTKSKNNLMKGEQASGESPFEYQYYDEAHYNSSKNQIRSGDAQNKISQIRGQIENRLAEIATDEILMME